MLLYVETLVTPQVRHPERIEGSPIVQNQAIICAKNTRPGWLVVSLMI